MKYTNNKNNISEILKVYIINILNIKIRPLVTEYALTIKLFFKLNPYAYFCHSWSYFDIQNLRLVILKNDKTIIAYHFGQYNTIKLVIMAQGRLYCPEATPRANTTFRGPLWLNRGHITGPLWKRPFLITFINQPISILGNLHFF